MKGIHRWTVIGGFPSQRAQWRGKCFHLMTLSWSDFQSNRFYCNFISSYNSSWYSRIFNWLHSMLSWYFFQWSLWMSKVQVRSLLRNIFSNTVMSVPWSSHLFRVLDTCQSVQKAILTHWWRGRIYASVNWVMHHWSRLSLVIYAAPSHYPKRWRLIVNGPVGTNLSEI